MPTCRHAFHPQCIQQWLEHQVRWLLEVHSTDSGDAVLCGEAAGSWCQEVFVFCNKQIDQQICFLHQHQFLAASPRNMLFLVRHWKKIRQTFDFWIRTYVKRRICFSKTAFSVPRSGCVPYLPGRSRAPPRPGGRSARAHVPGGFQIRGTFAPARVSECFMSEVRITDLPGHSWDHMRSPSWPE